MRGNNPILNMLSKLGDLLILNLLIIIGCLPIVTTGASLTAGHFAAIRLRREEGSGALSDFWKSFKENFKQATIIWSILLIVAACSLTVLWLFGKQSIAVSITCMTVFLLEVLISLWVFPLLSKFVNSTGNLIRNAVLLCLSNLFRTLGMLAITVLPIVLVIFSLYTLPLVIIFGLSMPMYVSACLYNKVFLKLEEQVRNRMENKTVD